MLNCFDAPEKSFTQESVVFEDSPEASLDDPKRIVIVVDGLKEISINLLEWVLKTFALKNRYAITILGIKPWLNIPLSSKTWCDIWSMDFGNMSSFLHSNHFHNDPKSLKFQRLIHLCQKYGVVPEIKSEMGHPMRLLVVEKISSLHATLVVFDRHHDRKCIEYYAAKVPCNMVIVKHNGGVHLIKKRKLIEENSSETKMESTPSMAGTCTKSIFPKHLIEFLNPKSRGKNDKCSRNLRNLNLHA